MRVAICATMKAPKMPTGTPRVCMLSACPSLIASIANIKDDEPGDADEQQDELYVAPRHAASPLPDVLGDASSF